MRMRTLAFVFSVVLGACAGGGGDDPAPTPDAAPAVPVCGDGTCAGAEVGACPQDCGGSVAQCGNLTCDAGETSTSCPNDCPAATCGDTVCDMANGENSTNCPGDCDGGQQGGTCPTDQTACILCLFDASLCPPGLDQNTCTECALGGGGGLGACEGGAPDGVCNAGAGEDSTTCPFDCM